MAKFASPADELNQLMLMGMSQECCDLIDDMRSALSGLHDDIAEYVKINSLYDNKGRPAIHNLWMDRARDALAAAFPEQHPAALIEAAKES